MELIKDADLLLSDNSSEKESVFNIEEEIKKARVRLTDKIDPDVFIMAIDSVDKFSKGNISLWIGKAKSKKTFALSMFVAAIIGGLRLFGKFNSNVKGKVILFDTEQSKNDVYKVLLRISKLAGSKVADNIIVFGLRSYNPEQRVKMVIKILDQFKNVNVEAIVIDGVRDLIYDINDAKEGTNIVSHLMKWSEVYNFHLAVVLHSNKGDGNARGHIGTELVNKSEVIIKIEREEKDHSISYFEEQWGRGKGTDPFAFQINKDGLPEVIDTTYGTDGINPDEFPY